MMIGGGVEIVGQSGWEEDGKRELAACIKLSKGKQKFKQILAFKFRKVGNHALRLFFVA